MKICIDARSPGWAGVLNYASCLVPRLVQLGAEHEFVILSAPKDPRWTIEGAQERVLPSNNPLSWMIWSNTALPRMMKNEGIDVYHSLKHITLWRGPARKIVTFHSARFFLHPEHYRWHEWAYWRVLSPPAARRYDAVIAVSEAEKRHYLEHIEVPEDRIRVIRLAADPCFTVVEDREALEDARAKHGLPERFLLFVGRLVPVKNIETLLRAYRIARDRGLEHELVLAGRKTWHYGALATLVKELRLEDHVVFTGAIVGDLTLVYNLADLFVFPSHYESFAVAPIEAMACGTPVVASDQGALPEVVGDAGALLPATDAEQFAETILEILGSPRRREDMIERGLERSATYSWERCARETLDLYEELVSRS